MECKSYNIFINLNNIYMFNIICKNACSYIKYIKLCEKFGVGCFPIDKLHTTCIKFGFFYHPFSQYYIMTPKIDTPYSSIGFDATQYKMVYIYRDPFERFVSLYNDKVKGDKGVWFNYKLSGITEKTTFKEFLFFAKLHIQECRYNNTIIEEHLRPQIDHYTTHVDYVVKIEDLQAFILENGISNETTLINHHPHDLKDYEAHKEEVLDLYSCDLEILEKYKDKIYVSSKI